MSTNDCTLLGLSTNEAARVAIMTYFKAAYDAAHADIKAIEVIYPNMEPPALETRAAPFIMLSIEPLSQEQEYMGSDTYITTKLLDITLWVRQYSGTKLANGFLDFTNSLGLSSVGGVVYGVPKPLAQKQYKGWELNPVLLSFIF
jgi:hypothetical protein